MGGKYEYTPDGGDLKAQLAWRKKCLNALTKEEYQYASHKSAWTHYYMALRTAALYYITLHTIIKFQSNFLVWMPLTFWQGAWITNFVWLMHDGTHQLIWNNRDTELKISLERLSYRIYGAVCGVSSCFFKEYHGQHHHRFFRGTDDPKATWFVPKTQRNWLLKMKYFGPGLMSIFKTLTENVSTVSEKTRDLQAQDKKFNQLLHLCMTVYTMYNFGFMFWMKVYFIPHFVFFPVWFMVSRCGQHYCCDPNHAPFQSTPHLGGFWADLPNFYGNYHVEHHTFAEVPAYNLKYLNSILAPRLYKKENMPMFKLRHLVWGWLVENRPHYEMWMDVAHDW